MSSRSLLSRVAAFCLAGTLAACGTSASQPGAISPVSPAVPDAHQAAVSPGGSGPPSPGNVIAPQETSAPPVQLASDLLTSIPASIPRSYGDSSLQTIAPDEFSADFEPSIFTGGPGSYVGFPPGFDSAVLEDSRFLPLDGVWIPYQTVTGRFVPLSFFDPEAGLYVYPALVLVAGMFVPIYRVVPSLLAPYSAILPISMSRGFVSPVDIEDVAAPLQIEPEILSPIPDLGPTNVINDITNLESRIVEPVTVSPDLVARVEVGQRHRLARLPADIRHRIEDRQQHGSPLVVPVTPAIERNRAIRQQIDTRIRREAERIAPDLHPAMPPPRPIARPEQPIGRPEQPVARRPEQPIARPERPVARRPELPVARPEQPIARPELPVARPEQPVARRPETPIARPEPPVARRPELPITRPERPVARRPETPIARLEQPVARRPETPIARPEQPVARRPELPVARPEQPIARPEPPVARRPETPIARLEQVPPVTAQTHPESAYKLAPWQRAKRTHKDKANPKQQQPPGR